MPNIGIYEMAKSKRAKPELKVVFETSALFTKVAYELLSSGVKKLIELNSQHSDLSIKWYLPSIVVKERQYQMQCEAFSLFPSVIKLERLLGHNLNITEDILKSRVNEAIEKQVSKLGISTLDIDTSQVDWKSLISRAVYRLPPFEPGDKEKGFRDSLIAETFLQLVSQSPTTPSVCRLAIVTNDNLLSDYLKSCTKKAKNVRVLSAVGELESLINTLVSKVAEKFIADIKEKVSNYFFEKENEASLFCKENIRDKIRESYGKELNSVPKADLQREDGTWWINEPVFVKKIRQRTFWMTLISIEAKLFKYESTPPQTFITSDLTSGLGSSVLPTTPKVDFSDLATVLGSGVLPTTPKVDFSDLATVLGSGVLPTTPTMKKINVATGRTSFEVHWSVNITPKKKFTHPHIEEIKFIDTKWEQK